jgi:hypothetical protein
MTHNTANAEEILFLLEILDSEREYYTFEEIVKELYVGEVREGNFKEFHPKPNKLFTSITPPDFKTLKNKLTEIHNKKNHRLVVKDVREVLKKEGPESATNFLIKERVETFKKFNGDFSENYEAMINVPYKPTKSWKQNWVEFVRDIIDFVSIMGLLPNYSKSGRFSFNKNEGFYPTELFKKYKKKNIKFEDLLMSFKYSNSVQNIKDSSMYNIKVRPFYSVLKLLEKLSLRGVGGVERNLLFGVVGCLNGEDEIDSAVNFIIDFIKNHGNKFDQKIAKTNFNLEGGSEFQKECGRIATGMSPLLEHFKLIVKRKIGVQTLISLSSEGKVLLDETPTRSYFYNQDINEFEMNPLTAALLYYFRNQSKKKIESLELKQLYLKFKDITKDQIDNSLSIISQIENPPILFEKNSIILSKIKDQYDINPYVDFDDFDVMDFVSIQKPIKQKGVSSESHVSSDLDFAIQNLRKSHNLTLKNINEFFAKNMVSNFVKLDEELFIETKYFDSEDYEKNSLLLIFAPLEKLTTFVERGFLGKIKEIIKNKKIDGIWIFSYSNNEEEEKKTKEKLEKIQHTLHNQLGINLFLSFFQKDCLKEYLIYILKKRKNYNFEYFDEQMVSQFWLWGSLFIGYFTHFFNDPSYLKTKLI